MANKRVSELQDSTLPIVTSDKVLVSRDGLTLTKATAGDLPISSATQTSLDSKINAVHDSSVLVGVNSSLDTSTKYFTGVFTWASKPTAASYANRRIFISDVGGGSVWLSNGTRWYPQGGSVRLFTMPADQSGTFATESFIAQYIIKAGLLQNRDKLRITYTAGKTAGSSTANHYLKLGTLGTTADPALTGCTTSAPGAANVSNGVIVDLLRTSATTIRRLGGGFSSSYTGVSTQSIVDANTVSTVPNLDSNAVYIGMSVLAGSPADTFSYYDFSIDLISGQ